MIAPGETRRRQAVSSRQRHWSVTVASRTLLILLGILFALVVLEIGFRIRYPDPRPRLVAQGLQLDNRYGVSFVPNAEGWNSSLRGEYSTYVEINSKGLHDLEHDYHKSPGVVRILALGDSVTAAIQVPLTDTFLKIAERQLNNTFSEPHFEVINAGVIGYGTSNELLFFKDEGHKYEPDFVLLAFFTGNDVIENVNSPLFELKDGELKEVRASPSPTDLLAPWEQPGNSLRKARNFLYTHSRLYSVSIELLVYTAIQRYPPLVQLLVDAGMIEVTRPAINLGNLYAYRVPPQEAWTMTEALILELRHQVEAHDARLVVAILPDESEVDEERWQTILEHYPELSDKQAQTSHRPSDILEEFLEEQAIDYIQCTPALRDYAWGSEAPLYYRYDGHFTPLGHRAAGQCISDYLVEEYERE